VLIPGCGLLSGKVFPSGKVIPSGSVSGTGACLFQPFGGGALSGFKVFLQEGRIREADHPVAAGPGFHDPAPCFEVADDGAFGRFCLFHVAVEGGAHFVVVDREGVECFGPVGVFLFEGRFVARDHPRQVVVGGISHLCPGRGSCPRQNDDPCRQFQGCPFHIPKNYVILILIF